MTNNSQSNKASGRHWIVRWWKMWLGLAALAIMVAWTAGCFRQQVKPGEVDVASGFPVPSDAPVVQVAPEQVVSLIDIPGTVESEQRVHLSSRVSATVAELFVAAGQKVSRGDLMIVLDDREIQEQQTAAQVRLNQAETEFNRTKALRSTNATTEQAYDSAESAYLSAQSELDRIKVMLSYTRITAPLDGVVTDRRVEIGDLASPGQVLVVLYDPSSMRMEVPVPIRLVHHLNLGTEVRVQLDTPSLETTGTVREVVSEIDPTTRTQKVKIGLDQLEQEVLPGTFGRVWIEEDPHTAILVPERSLQTIGQLQFVTLVRDNRGHRRMVRTGPRHGDRIELLSGLQAGDTILVPNPSGQEG